MIDTEQLTRNKKSERAHHRSWAETTLTCIITQKMRITRLYEKGMRLELVITRMHGAPRETSAAGCAELVLVSALHCMLDSVHNCLQTRRCQSPDSKNLRRKDSIAKNNEKGLKMQQRHTRSDRHRTSAKKQKIAIEKSFT